MLPSVFSGCHDAAMTLTPPLSPDPGRTDSVRSLGCGPVAPVGATMLRPLPLRSVLLGGGFLGALQRANSEVSIPMGDSHLRDRGAWRNFVQVAGGDRPTSDPEAAQAAYNGPCYEDAEAYKWLEAVAWEASRSTAGQPEEWLAEHTAEIAGAQAEDGYLNTYVQSGCRPERYRNLDFDHEIFNNGAMIQSAVAQYRTTGRTALLDVARRTADHLCREFGTGPDQRPGFCGHPVAEMGLVELYRATGEQRYLDQAAYFVEARGHSLLAPEDQRRAGYLSDRVPVRQARSPEGHAVRAIYLAAGATDVAIETGDASLLTALESQWEQMTRTKMYATGGLGSRWEGESFGNPYELPSDVGYGETCAAIACLQWNWRLLLATGRARYADLFEWQLYNAVLPGVSLDRTRFFYVNALQVRADSNDTDERAPSRGRKPWFGTSCCPTNLMRTVASLQHYVATATDTGVQVHQYGAGTIRAELANGTIALNVETDYPRDGRILLTVDEAPEEPTAIELRIPGWASGAAVSLHTSAQSAPTQQPTVGDYLAQRRSWKVGDRIELDLPLPPRLLHGHPRVEGIRGSVAIARGPLLYAVEQADHPDQVLVDDLGLTDDQLTEVSDDTMIDNFPMITATGMAMADPSELYGPPASDAGAPVQIRALPYFQWGNRGPGPMKVWLPRLRS